MVWMNPPGAAVMSGGGVLFGLGSQALGASSQSSSQPLSGASWAVVLTTCDEPYTTAGRGSAVPARLASTTANAASAVTSSPVPRPAEMSAKALAMLFETRVPLSHASTSGSPAVKVWLGMARNCCGCRSFTTSSESVPSGCLVAEAMVYVCRSMVVPVSLVSSRVVNCSALPAGRAARTSATLTSGPLQPFTALAG